MRAPRHTATVKHRVSRPDVLCRRAILQHLERRWHQLRHPLPRRESGQDALDLAAPVCASGAPPLCDRAKQPGTRLGRYEILAPLGEG